MELTGKDFHVNRKVRKNKQKLRGFLFSTCNNVEKDHPEGCKRGVNLCFLCGREGYHVRRCIRKNCLRMDATGKNKFPTKVQRLRVNFQF